MAHGLTTLVRLGATTEPFENALEEYLQTIVDFQVKHELSPVLDNSRLHFSRVEITPEQLAWIWRPGEKLGVRRAPLDPVNMWEFGRITRGTAIEPPTDIARQFVQLMDRPRSVDSMVQYFNTHNIELVERWLADIMQVFGLSRGNLLDAFVRHLLPKSTSIPRGLDDDVYRALVVVNMTSGEVNCWNDEAVAWLNDLKVVHLVWAPVDIARIIGISRTPQDRDLRRYLPLRNRERFGPHMESRIRMKGSYDLSLMYKACRRVLREAES